jgi:hypothetical protein
MSRVVILLMLSTLTGCYDYLVASRAWQGRGQGELAARRDDGLEVAIRGRGAEPVGSLPHDPPGTIRVRPKARRLKTAGAILLAIGGAATLLGGVFLPGSDRSQTLAGQVMLGLGVPLGAGGLGLLTTSAVATPDERRLPGF